jgi:hypothetical protein
MPIATRYLFIVSRDVAPEKEALFNEVHDTEHVPNLMKVAGVRAVTRLRTEPARFVLGGQAKELTGEGAPKYVAIYEIDSPAVLDSAAWEEVSRDTEASEKGRWPTEVRPYTRNRHHIVRTVL